MRLTHAIIAAALLALLPACGGVEPAYLGVVDQNLQVAPVSVLEADLPGCSSAVLAAVRQVRIMRHPSNTGLVVAFAGDQRSVCVDDLEHMTELVTARQAGLPGIPGAAPSLMSSSSFEESQHNVTGQNGSGNHHSVELAALPSLSHSGVAADDDPIPIVHPKRED